MKKTYNTPAIVVEEMKIKQYLLNGSAPASVTLNPNEGFVGGSDEVGARGFLEFDNEY